MSLPIKITNSRYTNSKAIKYLEERGVESRPLIAGNILKHPVSNIFNFSSSQDNLEGANYHHRNSFYVGLSPEHTSEDIDRLFLVMKDLDKVLEN